MDFDSWLKTDWEFNSNLESGNSDCEWAVKFMRKAFKAGQQSKQAEIDELQKRIDEALELINNQHDTSTIKFVRHAINKILKGEAE